MNIRTAIWFVALLLGLAACAGRSPPKRINPPAASVQELTVQADGSWRVLLRVQNFSSVGQSFQSIDLDLGVDGVSAGRLQSNTPRAIPGRTAEVFRIDFQPDAVAAAALLRFTASARSSVSWKMHGSITVDGRTHRSDFEGWLSPVPGLPDTYR